MWSRATDPAPRAAHSLRGRLLALVLAVVALASLAQALGAWRTALVNADALFDAQLQTLARSIEASGPGLPGHGPDFDFGVQIWGADGTLLFEGGAMRLPSPAVIGFSEAVVNGTRLRIYTLQAAQRVIQIAQDLDARNARARRLALAAGVPALAVGLLLMLAVWAVIDRSLAPVERLRRQLAGRDALDLGPLPEAGLPQEVQPLVQDLNLLFDRVQQAVRSQQQFVSDAAHELRSPLAAVKLQVQALRRHPGGPSLDEAVTRLEEGVDRATSLVSQLLSLARQEAAEPTPARAVQLEDLCRETVAEVLPQARARRVDLGLAEPVDPLVLSGEPEALRTLLRNLLENGLKFAPEGGRVDIVLRREPDADLLAVEDSGPGIAPEERERVFDRFFRGKGSDAVPGSGLGLAIVAAIARRHGATVRLERSARLGGLSAQVRFPRDKAGPAAGSTGLSKA